MAASLRQRFLDPGAAEAFAIPNGVPNPAFAAAHTCLSSHQRREEAA